jgi:putative ABC transport system ATP-binding protein
LGICFEIQRLQKKNWNTGRENSFLLSEISAKITQPERIAMVGASGQGKSTLLRMLACLERPDGGDIVLNGRSFKEMDIRLWRMQVCYVAQFPFMLPGSIEDNLKTVSQLHGTPYNAELARQLLNRLGLDYLEMDKPASDLSGGEKQRIALIRSLMLRPSILLLDEVTASLDQHNTRLIEELLLQWHAENETTLIWVTHDPGQAERISAKTWLIGNGTLVENETVCPAPTYGDSEPGHRLYRESGIES